MTEKFEVTFRKDFNRDDISKCPVKNDEIVKLLSLDEILYLVYLMQKLEKYFQNMFICDDEEYSENKAKFIETFHVLAQRLRKNYDYEFSNARELKK